MVALTGPPIGYSVIVALTGLPIGYNVIVALTGLPIGYSVIIALTGLPIGYSVIIALTGLPIGYSVIVALTGLPIGYSSSNRYKIEVFIGESLRSPTLARLRVTDHSQKFTGKKRITYKCFHICSCNGS